MRPEPASPGSERAAGRGGRPQAAAALSACLLAIVLTLLPAAARAAQGVRAAVLIDLATGKELYARNGDLPVPPASLTKVMTLFLLMDRVKAKKVRLTEMLRIRPQVAAVGGSSMRLRAGERVRLQDLAAGAAALSGNDAATAIALRVGGSQRRFVRDMNAKARALRMPGTVFKNPTGLPAAGQRTTARDMARLGSAYLRAHPSAAAWHRLRMVRHRGHAGYNTNTLLGVMPGVDGLKTGWTIASGYNIIATAQRGKTRLMAVVLGGSSRRTRDAMAARLLEAGFRHHDRPAQLRRAMGHPAPARRKVRR